MIQGDVMVRTPKDFFLFYQSSSWLPFSRSASGWLFGHQVGIQWSKKEEGGRVNKEHLYSKLNWGLLEEVIKRMWPWVDSRAGPRQSESSHSLPCSRMYVLPTNSHSRSHFQRCVLESYGVVEATWTIYVTARPLYELLRFWWISLSCCLQSEPCISSFAF